MRALIAYDNLKELLHFSSYDQLAAAHKQWVEDSIAHLESSRDSKWTASIAIGNLEFVERTKQILGARVKGRKVKVASECTQLREPRSSCQTEPFVATEQDNTYLWISV